MSSGRSTGKEAELGIAQLTHSSDLNLDDLRLASLVRFPCTQAEAVP